MNIIQSIEKEEKEKILIKKEEKKKEYLKIREKFKGPFVII